MKPGMGLLILLLLAAPASGEVYKWVDDKGRVHYGDKPVGKSADQATEVKIKEPGAPPPPDSRVEDRRKVLRSLEEARIARQRALQEQLQGKSEERRREKKCTEMLNELKDRERGGAIWYTLDKDGNREFWDDQRLERENAELRQKITKLCGKKFLDKKSSQANGG